MMIRRVRHVIILLTCVSFATLFHSSRHLPYADIHTESATTTATATTTQPSEPNSQGISEMPPNKPVAESSRTDASTTTSTTTTTTTTTMPSCLEPNLEEGTFQVLERQRQGLLPKPLPYPIFNVGLPKMGSNTLLNFFNCAGLRTNHGQNGQCFAQAQQQGVPLLTTCSPRIYRSQPQGAHKNTTTTSSSSSSSSSSLVQAWLQLDVTFPPDACYYPQMSMLDELHREAPNATFVLNFRPVRDWWRSLRHWHKMQRRLQDCDLPGLPRGRGRNPMELQDWWCQHVQNVRQFVRQHPSHALVELDLYQTPQSSAILAELFHTNASCWGHANANPQLQVPKKQ